MFNLPDNSKCVTDIFSWNRAILNAMNVKDMSTRMCTLCFLCSRLSSKDQTLEYNTSISMSGHNTMHGICVGCDIFYIWNTMSYI